MRAFLKAAIHLTAPTSNAWHYWYMFPNNLTACRGVYRTWQDAAAAARGKHRVRKRTEILTFRAADGVRIHSLRERDYPIMLNLRPLLNADTKVLNVGGSLGKEYCSYRETIPFPTGLQWRVCEVPEVVAAGNAMLKEEDYPGLSFSETIDGEADIFLSCGTLQYLEADLPSILRGLKQLPDHVFISRVPMQNRVGTYYTVQNNGSAAVPYRIDNEDSFIRSMADVGYRLVDGWRDDRRTVIPYYPEGTVNGYMGFYFALRC